MPNTQTKQQNYNNNNGLMEKNYEIVGKQWEEAIEM